MRPGDSAPDRPLEGAVVRLPGEALTVCCFLSLREMKKCGVSWVSECKRLSCPALQRLQRRNEVTLERGARRCSACSGMPRTAT